MYAKIELERLNYIRNHQTHLQAEVYQGLADAVQNSDSQVDGAHIGKKVILPSSFTGGARFQHQLYQDAMAIVHQFGKPDFFITFTCNPCWKEITDELLDCQSASDHPDIISRVLKLKLQFIVRFVACFCSHPWKDGGHNLCHRMAKEMSSTCPYSYNV